MAETTPTTDLAAAIRACQMKCWWCGKDQPPQPCCSHCHGSGRCIAPEVAAALRAVQEAAARLCVFRSCLWSQADDRQGDDYRRGVEDAASQLAAAIRQLDVS